MANYRQQEKRQNEKSTSRNNNTNVLYRIAPEKINGNSVAGKLKRPLKHKEEDVPSYMLTFNEDDWSGY